MKIKPHVLKLESDMVNYKLSILFNNIICNLILTHSLKCTQIYNM